MCIFFCSTVKYIQACAFGFCFIFFLFCFLIRSDLFCFLLFYRAWIVNLKLSDIVYIVKNSQAKLSDIVYIVKHSQAALLFVKFE